MSWDGYITNLTAHGMIDDAAIWGKKPGEESQWAASPGLSNISVEEIRRLAGDTNALFSNGPTIGGMKCRLLQDNSDDPNVLSMNLKSVKDEQGNTRSVCVGVSKTALVIAKGSIESIGGTLVQQVHPIVKHLKDNNF
ncbi:profilin-1 [Epinephelus fuscoguttatus]|uniref:profilin-1 n=1 Tax=Epinephelus fuscoguttatus TaxID=293821 RepID=UPI0020CFF63C|nr:profilin-1 [Epinephelus fuscoguttatus]